MTGWKHHLLLWGAALVGAILLTSAFLLQLDDWHGTLHAVLVTVGAAVLLIIPIEWFTGRLRSEVQSATIENQDAVEQVRSESEHKFEELGRRLTDLERLDSEAREAHDEARSRDHEVFDAVVSLDSKVENLFKALARAESLRLISTKGVWTSYSETSYSAVRFHNMSGDKRRVEAVLYGPDRHEIWGRIYLAANQSNRTVLDKLREIARRHGESSTPTVSSIFKGVADTLKFAEKHSNDTPLLQYFPPQWALTETAIIAPEKGQSIGHSQGDRARRDLEVKKKTWLDFDSYFEASYAAERQYPMTETQGRWLEENE